MGSNRGGRGSRMAALALAAWACAAAACAQFLEIEARAVASGPQVLLKDLLRPGKALPEGWGERSIAMAPANRQTLDLTIGEIAHALNEYGDMGSVVLRGKPMVKVSARHNEVEAERILLAVNAYCENHEAWKDRRFELAEEQMRLPQVPQGKLEIEVASMAEGPGSLNPTAELKFTVDGVPWGERNAAVELQELRPFWAAARPLSRGEPITEEKLEKRWMSERDAARYYPADHSVAGMELRRNVQAGQLLAAGMLNEPVFARRGEIVRVISNRGGLTVTLRAKALADGRRSETIMCVNEQSGKKMNVRLVRPRRALLEQEVGEMASLGGAKS
jgi:flagella basal body P-ring formation protein FlgA